MRIIIESEEKKETSVQRFEEPEIEEGLDGGAPPESLLQLMAAEASELAPEAEPMDVEDAGPPAGVEEEGEDSEAGIV